MSEATYKHIKTLTIAYIITAFLPSTASNVYLKVSCRKCWNKCGNFLNALPINQINYFELVPSTYFESSHFSPVEGRIAQKKYSTAPSAQLIICSVIALFCFTQLIFRSWCVRPWQRLKREKKQSTCFSVVQLVFLPFAYNTGIYGDI